MFHTQENKNGYNEAILHIAVENTHPLCSNSNRNPLVNPLIVARLLEVCDLSDLPTLRLVSKQWYSLSLTRFRDKVPVVIHPRKAIMQQNFLGRRLTDTEIEKRLRWSTLGVKLDNLGGKPFRCFLIFEVEFLLRPRPDVYLYQASLLNNLLEDEEISKNLTRFWRRHGESIRQLEVRSCFISSWTAYRNEIFYEMPNLEKLHLHEVRLRLSERGLRTHIHPADLWEDGNSGERAVQENLKHVIVQRIVDLPSDWTQFSQHFPKIRKLEIRFLDTSKHGHDLAQLIESPQLEITIAELKSRKTDVGLEYVMPLLQMPLLTIGTFDISFDNFGDEEESLLSNLFLRQGHKLKELFVSLKPSRFPPCADFPCQPGRFDTLTALSLDGSICGNLHFLEKFPNLEVLKLSQPEQDKILEGTDLARLENFRLSQLQIFEFLVTSSAFCISVDVMTAFVKAMPNVEIFRGQLSNGSLRIVCQHWRANLRDLHNGPCWTANIDDEGITGIVAGQEERLPNITDLKCLEVFSLGDPERISDASIRHGFLEMPRLQNINVKLQTETSDEAFRALQERFPDSLVCRMKGGGHTYT